MEAVHAIVERRASDTLIELRVEAIQHRRRGCRIQREPRDRETIRAGKCRVNLLGQRVGVCKRGRAQQHDDENTHVVVLGRFTCTTRQVTSSVAGQAPAQECYKVLRPSFQRPQVRRMTEPPCSTLAPARRESRTELVMIILATFAVYADRDEPTPGYITNRNGALCFSSGTVGVSLPLVSALLAYLYALESAWYWAACIGSSSITLRAS